MGADADVAEILGHGGGRVQRDLPVFGEELMLCRAACAGDVLAAREKRRRERTGLLEERVLRAERFECAAAQDGDAVGQAVGFAAVM